MSLTLLLDALKATVDNAGNEIALIEMDSFDSPFSAADLNQIRLMCGELSMKIHTMKNKPPCSGCYFCECPPYRCNQGSG